MTPPTHQFLRRLHLLDKSLPDFHEQLNGILHTGHEYDQCVAATGDNDSEWLVNYLDEALNALDQSTPAFRKCLRELKTLCGNKTILPTSCTLPLDGLKVDDHPFARGGFGDIYDGTLNGSAICVKRLQVPTKDELETTTKTFPQEAIIWKHLKHPNILPLLGVTISPHQLISERIPGGNLSHYIQGNPAADLLGLLSGVARGLDYLHSCNVIHGDLKGVNILVQIIGEAPQALIADFGLAIVTRNPDSIRTATHQPHNTARWTAPEVLLEENPTKESDIYSFAMVMIEVFTKQVPFGGDKVYKAIAAVLDGKRPPRPANPSCTDRLWTLIQRCWDEKPQSRPKAEEVLELLLSAAALPK